MNNQLFQQARAAYAQKDFQGALEVYQQCLQDEASPSPPARWASCTTRWATAW